MVAQIARNLTDDVDGFFKGKRRRVRYRKGSDMLLFSDTEVAAQKYVRVTGRISNVTLNVSTNGPAWFILDNPEVRQVKVTCLQGTLAARQLRDLDSARIGVIGICSIDLARALEDRCRINLVALDSQPA